MLSADMWTATSGNWNQPNNWSAGVPTSSSAVTISSSSATITIPSGFLASAASITLPAGDTLSMPNASGGNLIGNSGFESPTASGSSTAPDTWWTYGTAVLSSQYAYTGAQSLEVSGDSSGAGQSFNVAPGQTYTASVYAMTPQGDQLSGSIGASMQLIFYDSGGNQLSSYSPPNSITVGTSSSSAGGPLADSVGNQGWNFFSTTAVAPANAATASLILNTYAPNSPFGGAEFYDDAELVLGTVAPAQLSVGSLTNQGTLVIGAGDPISVSGGFTQASTGKLEVELGGAPATNLFGSLTIGGTASLAGTLQVALAGGYVPANTDSFIPVTYTSQTGSFATTTLPSGSGYQMAAATTFTNIAISAAPASATITTVNTTSDLHAAQSDLIGINATYWDGNVSTSQTEQMMTAAGISLVRFPGGSASDDFHFNISDNYGDPSGTTIPQFAEAIAAEGATGIVTVDYGSGSPQEAAAELAYLVGSPTDGTEIGSGIEWNDSTNQWQTVNWGTVGQWASLRAAMPLMNDDGLNFLRIDHPAPFSSITYWEIGNEEYGSWEVDHHGTALPGGGSTGAKHDPMTYVLFAKQFATLAAMITKNAGLPAISIGIDSEDPTGAADNNWTRDVLTDGASKSVGFVPGFISDHSYVQAPGSESDSFLLNDTVSAAGNLDDWSVRSVDYESLLNQTAGSQASSVQLLATEFNSVYTTPGKQSTSLVNGLFIADSLGSLLDSGYAGSAVWDLRNGPDNSQNNSNSLYGWREIGDYGVLGDGNSAPSSGTYVAYPSYFALQLVSKFVASGGEVVSATSNYGDLDTYALVQPGGDLELLVINTNPAAAITSQFNLTGFQPSGAVQLWQYGETQDTAQSQSSTGAASLANSKSTLTLNGANFNFSFPAYSMTELDITQSPTVATAASGTVNTTTGKTAALSVLGNYNGAAGDLTYTWSAVGTPPAPVRFSPNGAGAANSSTATFTKAGTYTLKATITSPAGTSTTSSVVVTVPQLLTSISLGLASSNLATTGTQQFGATALDQFGAALGSQPSFNWSVTSGPGTITNTGIFTPPYETGSTTIKVASGSTSATQVVTLPGPAVWGASSGGSWNSSSNWQSSSLGGNVVPPGTRGNIGDVAEFESTGGGTVTLDGLQPTLAALSISSGSSGYIIATGSGGKLLMESSTGNAAINILAGNQTIQAAIDLLTSTTVSVAQNSSLLISGAISGSGMLNIVGPGPVTMSGPNTFTGGTSVLGGSLVVENGASLGGSLIIGADITVMIAPTTGSGPAAAESASTSAASLASENPALAARIADFAARIARVREIESQAQEAVAPAADASPIGSTVSTAISTIAKQAVTLPGVDVWRPQAATTNPAPIGQPTIETVSTNPAHSNANQASSPTIESVDSNATQSIPHYRPPARIAPQWLDQPDQFGFK